VRACGGGAHAEAGRGLGALTELINHEVRLRRAKYLGALADRLFRKECARLGLSADEAIKCPLLSIITRQGGGVVTPRMPTENGIEFDGADMFVVRNGKRIAKRDQQTKTWIALEPGWQVSDVDGGEAIEIVYRGMRVQ
jgi:hypothetical protein